MSTQHAQYVLLFSVLVVISDCLQTLALAAHSYVLLDEVNAIVFPSKLYMHTHSMGCRLYNETLVY